jgi:hypothetical protein
LSAASGSQYPSDSLVSTTSTAPELLVLSETNDDPEAPAQVTPVPSGQQPD